MSFNQLKNVLTNIKAHYQNFSICGYVVEEWYKVLKNYDFDDVMEKLVDHLTSNNSNEFPKAYQLIKELKTIKEKERETVLDNIYTVSCNLCEKWMSLSDFDKHYYECLKEFGNKKYN